MFTDMKGLWSVSHWQSLRMLDFSWSNIDLRKNGGKKITEENKMKRSFIYICGTLFHFPLANYEIILI